MKNILTAFVFLIFSKSFHSFSQTKQESEEWLKYNLEKYYGDNVNDANKVFNLKSNGKFYRKSYQYDFNGTFLMVAEINYIDYSSGPGEITDRIQYMIDLKKLKSIEIHKLIGYSGYSRIELIFNRPTTLPNSSDYRKYAVTSFDLNENQKRLDLQNSYRTNHYIESVKDETINSEIDTKIAKALEHLAIINGAKIIKKDLF